MLPHASHSIVRCYRLEDGPWSGSLHNPSRAGMGGCVLAPGDEPGLLYVALYLLFELVDARESTLFPYASHEAHVYHSPVEIALEVEKISLDTALGASEGGSHPDVRTRSVLDFEGADEPGVDAAGWYHRVRIGQHVSGGEPDRPSTLVSDHHLTPEHVRTSE